MCVYTWPFEEANFSYCIILQNNFQTWPNKHAPTGTFSAMETLTEHLSFCFSPVTFGLGNGERGQFGN